jgi:hypothetical protein
MFLWVAKDARNPHIRAMRMKLYPKGPPRSEPTAPKPPPSKEDLAARKARQAEEGVLAMAEYQRQQKETLERTARLRAERLARDTKARARKAKTGDAKNGDARAGDAA